MVRHGSPPPIRRTRRGNFGLGSSDSPRVDAGLELADRFGHGEGVVRQRMDRVAACGHDGTVGFVVDEAADRGSLGRGGGEAGEDVALGAREIARQELGGGEVFAAQDGAGGEPTGGGPKSEVDGAVRGPEVGAAPVPLELAQGVGEADRPRARSSGSRRRHPRSGTRRTARPWVRRRRGGTRRAAALHPRTSAGRRRHRWSRNAAGPHAWPRSRPGWGGCTPWHTA